MYNTFGQPGNFSNFPLELAASSSLLLDSTVCLPPNFVIAELFPPLPTRLALITGSFSQNRYERGSGTRIILCGVWFCAFCSTRSLIELDRVAVQVALLHLVCDASFDLAVWIVCGTLPRRNLRIVPQMEGHSLLSMNSVAFLQGYILPICSLYSFHMRCWTIPPTISKKFQRALSCSSQGCLLKHLRFPSKSSVALSRPELGTCIQIRCLRIPLSYACWLRLYPEVLQPGRQSVLLSLREKKSHIEMHDQMLRTVLIFPNRGAVISIREAKDPAC